MCVIEVLKQRLFNLELKNSAYFFLRMYILDYILVLKNVLFCLFCDILIYFTPVFFVLSDDK